ncbi:hypothetical protein GJ496_010902 [Pomphorhynchus laevis]|nr:hypothetical protein GJ496_010902 [Pomphorhynchus laevis]
MASVTSNGIKSNINANLKKDDKGSEDYSENSRSSSTNASFQNSQQKADPQIVDKIPVLCKSDYDLLLKNRFYEEKQVSEWFVSFIKDCPDGKLKKDQLSDAFLQSFGEKKRNQFVSTAYRVFDPDSTGYINFVSFLVALSIASQCIFEDKFKLVFAFFDNKINEALVSNRLMKDLTLILQVIYDFVDENNRSGPRSPKSRAQHIIKSCSNGKKKFMVSDLLEACLQDEILTEVAKKCIINA